MSPSAVPNVWNVYNLRGPPFFGDPRAYGYEGQPSDLCVGRERELEDLAAHLHGRDSSRQAVGGAVGVGKTTLVQRLKAIAMEDACLTTNSFVSSRIGDAPESFFGRVIGVVYHTILAYRPILHGHAAMQAAQRLVRSTRQANRPDTRGATLADDGTGGPMDVVLDGRRILRDLLTVARRANDVRGLLLHLDNRECVHGRHLKGVADLLRSLREPLFGQDGLHIVMVSSTDALNDMINTHAQVRNMFRAPLLLDPLARADVDTLLRKRYDGCRLRPDVTATAPVEGAAVDRLCDAFQGDLHGLLKALDDGVRECIGLRSIDSHASVPPVGLPELAGVLEARYRNEASRELEEFRCSQLTRWIEADAWSAKSRRDLMELWGLTQRTVLSAINSLVTSGFLLAHPRQGGGPVRYTLSGRSRTMAGVT